MNQKSLTRASWILVFCLMTAQPLLGQGVTTGALSGVVVDPNGDAVPGAQVQAVLQPTATRYQTVTDRAGRFLLPNVRVGGPYQVAVGLAGFETEQNGDVGGHTNQVQQQSDQDAGCYCCT